MSDKELDKHEKHIGLTNSRRLLINYPGVQNTIIKRMNNIARNHHYDKKRWVMAGVFKRERNDLFKNHVASPFLVSWLPSLQLELLLNAEK